jgi:hypothetical protein
MVVGGLSQQTLGYCTQVALTKPREKPDGSMADAEAVESCGVPTNGDESTVRSAPFSEKICSLMIVPVGMFRASITNTTAVVEFNVTSGTLKLPVGLAGNATPPTVNTFTEL